jgi:hypothetical protein
LQLEQKASTETMLAFSVYPASLISARILCRLLVETHRLGIRADVLSPAMNTSDLGEDYKFPENYQRGLPYITGLLILNDAETELSLTVVDSVTFSTSSRFTPTWTS